VFLNQKELITDQFENLKKQYEIMNIQNA